MGAHTNRKLSNPTPPQEDVRKAQDYIISYGLEPSESFSGIGTLELSKIELTIRTCLQACLREGE